MPTLKEALHYYLKETRRPLTNHQYSLVVGQLIAAIGPARDVSRVTYEDLADYFAAMEARGLKDTSIASYATMVKAFFTWCVNHEYIDKSPARLLKRRPPKQSDVDRDRGVPPAELRQMIEYARLTSPRNYALLLFIADTGCRAGGAASLQRARLHLDEGFAMLDEKGGKLFKGRFGEFTADVLRAWLRQRPEPSDAHDFVWTGLGPHYRPLTPDGISYIVRVAAKKTGASHVWAAHSLRHAVGEAYAKAGIPPTATQQKLGHSDVMTTLENYYPKSREYVDQVSRDNPLIALRPTADEPPQETAPNPKIIPFSRSS